MHNIELNDKIIKKFYNEYTNIDELSKELNIGIEYIDKVLIEFKNKLDILGIEVQKMPYVFIFDD